MGVWHFPSPGLFTKESSYFIENSHWNHGTVREKVENCHSTDVAVAACGPARTDQTFSASTILWLQLQLVLTVVDFLMGNSSSHCEVHIDNVLESKKVRDSGKDPELPRDFHLKPVSTSFKPSNEDNFFYLHRLHSILTLTSSQIPTLPLLWGREETEGRQEDWWNERMSG